MKRRTEFAMCCIQKVRWLLPPAPWTMTAGRFMVTLSKYISDFFSCSGTWIPKLAEKAGKGKHRKLLKKDVRPIPGKSTAVFQHQHVVTDLETEDNRKT